MGIKRFDHKTKVKARSERWNLQTASQLYTKQVGTREINQIIESLLEHGHSMAANPKAR